MTRTVKVGLDVEEGPFVRGVKRAEAEAKWHGAQIMPSGGGGGSPVTHDNRISVYPQQANFTVQDLQALQARQDAMARIGRPR